MNILLIEWCGIETINHYLNCVGRDNSGNWSGQGDIPRENEMWAWPVRNRLDLSCYHALLYGTVNGIIKQHPLLKTTFKQMIRQGQKMNAVTN